MAEGKGGQDEGMTELRVKSTRGMRDGGKLLWVQNGYRSIN